MKYKPHFFILVLSLFACSEQTDNEPLTAENASDQIGKIADNIANDVITMVESDGIEGLSSLMDLLDISQELARVSFENNEELVSGKLHELSTYFTSSVAERLTDETDFWDYTGIYEWNYELDDFIKVEDSDILIVDFPVKDSPENNGQFRLLDISFVETGEEELTSVIKADLSVDGDLFIDLDYLVTYTPEGFIEIADVSLDVLPFSLELSLDDSQPIQSTLELTMLLDGENIVDVDVSFEYNSGEKEEVVLLFGEISYRQLRLLGNIDIRDLDESVDSDPNDYFNMEVYIEDQKAGDIIFELELVDNSLGAPIEEYVPYLQYADGNSERLADLFADAQEEIEELLDEVE